MIIYFYYLNHARRTSNTRHCTAFLSWIAATGLFSPATTKEIVYIITLLITPIVKGLSKLFGVKVIDDK